MRQHTKRLLFDVSIVYDKFTLETLKTFQCISSSLRTSIHEKDDQNCSEAVKVNRLQMKANLDFAKFPPKPSL